MTRFTVEDAFLIDGRSPVVTGVLDGERRGFSIGARVRVSRPDGTCLVSAVRGADVFRPCFTESRNIGVLLAEGVAEEDVPRGSVVALGTA